MLSDKVYPTKDEIGWIFSTNNEQYWGFKNTGVVKYFYNKKYLYSNSKLGTFTAYMQQAKPYIYIPIIVRHHLCNNNLFNLGQLSNWISASFLVSLNMKTFAGPKKCNPTVPTWYGTIQY